MLIIYDGEELMVTSNLHDFLLQPLRLLEIGEQRPMWIDAICINQNDLEKRSSQVMLMTEILRDSRTVVVWLGQAEEETRCALQMVKLTASFSQDQIGQLNF